MSIVKIYYTSLRVSDASRFLGEKMLKEMLRIRNPVWLGWSFTIEYKIGATRMLIMKEQGEFLGDNVPLLKL